jgi:hypothetical protein
MKSVQMLCAKCSYIGSTNTSLTSNKCNDRKQNKNLKKKKDIGVKILVFFFFRLIQSNKVFWT